MTTTSSPSQYIDGDRQPATPDQVRSLQPQWRDSEKVRRIDGSIEAGESTAAIWLRHRDHPNLVFRLELDGDGGVVSLTIRPATFVVRSEAGLVDDEIVQWQSLEVDETSTSTESPRLTTTLLRKVPLDQLRLEATATLTLMLRAFGSDDLPDPKRYRRSSLTDLDLGKFAKEWVELVHAQVRNPVAVLKERMNLSYNGVIYRRRQAVARGLMTGAMKQGLTGGAALTDKARDLLKERENATEKVN